MAEWDDTEEGLCTAFSVFDQEGTGIITTTQLKEVMMNYGEKMTEEEVDEMIKEIKPEKAKNFVNINYADFVKLMYNPK